MSDEKDRKEMFAEIFATSPENVAKQMEEFYSPTGDFALSLALDYTCENCLGKLTSEEYQTTRPLCTKCRKSKAN